MAALPLLVHKLAVSHPILSEAATLVCFGLQRAWGTKGRAAQHAKRASDAYATTRNGP